MKAYAAPVEQVIAEYGSDPKGLSSREAVRRLEKYGKNKLKEAKKESLFHRFLNQLKDPMILILLVAAGVSAVTSIYSQEGLGEVAIILVVVLINAILGVYQESKAEKAIEALQAMTAATSKVLRDGEIVHLKSEELVPGDVVLLEAGDAVPADGRLLESASLKIEEAALTGESVPVDKDIQPLDPQSGDVPLGDRKNMVYMGSTVVYGRGVPSLQGPAWKRRWGRSQGSCPRQRIARRPCRSSWPN